MGITIRAATADDTEAMRHVDGRNFGSEVSQADLELRMGVMDLDRFFLAFDGKELVGITGIFGFDVTLPGGAALPMGGITWASVAVTHRRQGVLSSLMARCHDDVDERSEPLAMLGASEGGIYERFGYGICSRHVGFAIDARRAIIRPEYVPRPGTVRFLDDDAAAPHIAATWERYRPQRPCEVSRSEAWHRMMAAARRDIEGDETRTFYLGHADGYAAYRVNSVWNSGAPAHTLWVNELVALTPDAHAALWHTLLSTDLIGTVRTRRMPIDDPLPYLLTDQRQCAMVSNHDGAWANVRDLAACFAARRYAVADRMVMEVDGVRYAVEGAADGAEVTKVRSAPDVRLTRAAAGSLLFGGVSVSALVAGRRATVRNAALARKLDAFVGWSPQPASQTDF
jgi:predicted acetyltransferase